MESPSLAAMKDAQPAPSAPSSLMIADTMQLSPPRATSQSLYSIEEAEQVDDASETGETYSNAQPILQSACARTETGGGGGGGGGGGALSISVRASAQSLQQ
ncbi:MAG: hypothetical protein EOO38_17280, partial [Cytophagaceae bacterium]